MSEHANKLRLQVFPSEGKPYERLVEGPVVQIGRAVGSDVWLQERSISRRHARLLWAEGNWQIEDLGSRFGTRLNGRGIEGPTSVGPGDVLQLSESQIRLVAPEEPETGDVKLAAQAPSRTAELGSPIFRNATELLQTQVPQETAGVRGEMALRRYAERLRLLNEVHRALGSSMQHDELLELILDRVFDHLRPEQAAIYLRDPEGQLFRAASRTGSSRAEDETVSRSLVREVVEKGLAALVLDVESDQRFAASESIQGIGIRSLVAAPLIGPEATLGMITLSSKAAVRRFSEEDMELLVSLASVAAQAINNSELERERSERLLFERELNLARRIQVALLPDRLPEIPGYELLAGNIPSRTVSGDYYVAVPRASGEECVLMLADVSGKGMAASLLTASLEALAAGPIEDGRPVDEICDRLSRQLDRRTPPERYATTVIAMLELGTGRLSYANAGHCPPILVRAAGEVRELPSTGPPIGLIPQASYHAEDVQLTPGDLLFLYTDGFVEAMSPEREDYGSERLMAVCQRQHQRPLDELVEAIEEDLGAFARGVPYEDDRTFLVLRRRSA